MAVQSGASASAEVEALEKSNGAMHAPAAAPPVTPEVVERTIAALRERNVGVRYVPTKEAALAAVLEMLPRGARVANGGSTSLAQIGLIATLSNDDSGYEYLNKVWLNESDTVKRNQLRVATSLQADYFLGSIQAIVETG
ncbi:MAG TPA: LUD domain-containing protein, partial [Chloroflexota bacterium]